MFFRKIKYPASLPVVDNLLSTIGNVALSANQGRVLNETINALDELLVDVSNSIPTIPQIVDDLLSTDVNSTLSANQGRVLNEKIIIIESNNDVVVSGFVDNSLFVLHTFDVFFGVAFTTIPHVVMTAHNNVLSKNLYITNVYEGYFTYACTGVSSSVDAPNFSWIARGVIE